MSKKFHERVDSPNGWAYKVHRRRGRNADGAKRFLGNAELTCPTVVGKGSFFPWERSSSDEGQSGSKNVFGSVLTRDMGEL